MRWLQRGGTQARAQCIVFDMHCRLGHQHKDGVRRACAGSDRPMHQSKEPMGTSEAWVLGKRHAAAQEQFAEDAAQDIGEMQDADLIGRLGEAVGLPGYLVSVVTDGFSRYTSVGNLESRSTQLVLDHVGDAWQLIETQTGRKGKVLCSDCGSEYVSQ